MYYTTVMWNSPPRTTPQSLAIIRYFCDKQSKWALSVSDALPHDGEGLCSYITVPDTPQLPTALMRLTLAMLSKMKNARGKYAFLFSMACTEEQQLLRLPFGAAKLKTKYAVQKQFAAGHAWRQKNLDTIGLIGYSATPQVSAKHSCHLFFWEGIGIYNHLVIVYSL